MGSRWLVNAFILKQKRLIPRHLDVSLFPKKFKRIYPCSNFTETVQRVAEAFCVPSHLAAPAMFPDAVILFHFLPKLQL